MNVTERARARHFLTLLGLTVLRVFFTMDVPIQAVQGEHDFLLYIRTANALLTRGDLGEWTTHTLTKLPGFAFLLAGVKSVGLTYPAFALLSIAAAGLVWVWVLHGVGVSRKVQAWIYGVVLFHPVTFELGFQVTRERTSHLVFLVLLGLSVPLIGRLRKGRIRWGVLFTFAGLFAVGRLLREEDTQLYWVLLGLLGLGTAFLRARVWQTAAVLAVPLIMSLGVETSLRGFVKGHYKLGILHELSEGEYPKMVATFRSVQNTDGALQNRHTMMPLKTLDHIATLWPEFKPVMKLIPETGLFSCWRFQICDDWTNGWMVFWVKDGWVKASRAQDLMAAQDAYRYAREKVEALCASGVLTCKPDGTGLLRPLFSIQGLRLWPAWGLEFARTWHQTLFPRVKVNTSRQYHIAPADTEGMELYRSVTGAEVYAAEDLQESEFGKTLRLVWIYLAVIGGGIGILTVGFVACRRNWKTLTSRNAIRVLDTPLGWATLFCLAYCVARNLALSSVAVTMGWLDDRLFGGMHLVGCVLVVWAVGTRAVVLRRRR